VAGGLGPTPARDADVFLDDGGESAHSRFHPAAAIASSAGRGLGEPPGAKQGFTRKLERAPGRISPRSIFRIGAPPAPLERFFLFFSDRPHRGLGVGVSIGPRLGITRVLITLDVDSACGDRGSPSTLLVGWRGDEDKDRKHRGRGMKAEG
jgi:hypothetical protein